MSTPHDEHQGAYAPGNGEPVAAGEVVDLAGARRARGLDQTTVEALDDLSGQAGGGEALSGEVIDAPEPETVAPAPRPAKVIAHRDVVKRPVLPDWLTSRESFMASARWAVGYTSHVCAYHAVRLPVYALRLAGRAPVGAGRLTKALHAWVSDSENLETRRALLAATKGDPATFLRVRKDARAVSRRRGTLTVLGLASASAAATGVAVLADPVWQAATVAATLGVLGVVGRAKDTNAGGTATASAKVPPLTGDLIRDALVALRLGSVNSGVRQDEKAIRFLSIVRDGAGFRADIDLPPGATASQVAERRSQLASGLRRPLGCVWPSGDPDVHEGRLILYVGDKSLSQSAPAPFPLAKRGTVNIFEPIPVGVDQRGRKVETTLIFASGVVGAIPRMGKTFTMRLLLLAAALDPRVEMHVHDLRGGADLAPLAKVAHYYRSGDDPEDMTGLLADARAMRKEMMRRYKVVRETLKGDPRCPEGKVTDELASDKSLGLHPILAAYDETQVMFEHPQHGKELREIFEDLVRRGPAAGIMVWLATQRPDDKSIPAGISANAVLRFCLKVMGWRENNMVLGDGMYAAGYSATTFSRKDLGVAYMVGEGDDPVIVRTYYVDGPAAETVADRARTIRQAQDRLTGMAAGDEEPDTDDSTILDHLLAVWPAQDPDWPNGKVWSDDLAARLATSVPALYEGWTGGQVNAAVKPHGIEPKQVKHQGKNRWGLERALLINELNGTNHDQTRHDENKED